MKITITAAALMGFASQAFAGINCWDANPNFDENYSINVLSPYSLYDQINDFCTTIHLQREPRYTRILAFNRATNGQSIDVEIQLVNRNRDNPGVIFTSGCLELFKGLTDSCIHDTARFAGGYRRSDDAEWAVQILSNPDYLRTPLDDYRRK